MMITLVLVSYFIIMEVVYKIKILDLFLSKICPIITRVVLWFWPELVHVLVPIIEHKAVISLICN